MNSTVKTVIKVVGIIVVIGGSYYVSYKVGDTIGKRVTVPAVTKILNW